MRDDGHHANAWIAPPTRSTLSHRSRERDEEIRWLELGAVEAARSDADDRQELIIDDELLANRVRLAGEATLPERMTQHDDVVAVRQLVVGWPEQATRRGVDTERNEVLAGRLHGGDFSEVGSLPRRHRIRRHRGHRIECST